MSQIGKEEMKAELDDILRGLSTDVKELFMDDDVVHEEYNTLDALADYHCMSEDDIQKVIKQNEVDFGDLWKAGYSYTRVAGYGGEDQGKEYYSVYEFTKKDTENSPKILVKFEGWYQSYHGSEYTHWKFVEPVEKTVIVYE